MKLATTTSDFSSYAMDGYASAKAIADAGFRYIDYSFQYDYDRRSGLQAGDWRPYADKLLKLADERGLQFVQAHAPMGSPLVKNGQYESFMQLTKQSIEAAAYLGIPNIVVHSGYVKDMSKEETFKKNVLFYEELLRVAEKCNITVLTENFNKMVFPDYYWIDSAEAELELVERVNHPLLQACWDVGHGNLQELPQHEALGLLGSHVRGVHIQDNCGNDDTHFMPYQGTLNMDSVMHGLLDIHYEGYFTFEADNTPLPARKRRKFEKDTRCLQLPIEFKKRYERILYEIGRYVLTQYDCFEE